MPAVGAVGSDCLVMAAPFFDDDLVFREGVEDIAVKEFIAKAGVEALDFAIHTERARLDVSGRRAVGGDPRAYRKGGELGRVAGAQTAGGPSGMKRSLTASIDRGNRACASPGSSATRC